MEFDDWLGRLELRLRSDELHPILEEHLSKYRSLIPSLALLIHLIDGGVGPIRIGPLMKAIAWGEYLESHAQRVYHVAANPDIAAATALARKIMKGELTDGFTLREVHRHEWSGLTDRDADLLCELDWLRWTKEETGGAPKVRYWINPKIVDLPPKRPDRTDKSPENDPPSVLSGCSGADAEETGGSAEYPGTCSLVSPADATHDSLSVPDGWEPSAWADHLEGMAEKCQDLHPDLAAKYRGQAGAIRVALGDSA